VYVAVFFVQVRAAISARASSWQETRQPSMGGRHGGYVAPRAVIVTTQPDVPAAAAALTTKTNLRITVWSSGRRSTEL